jgi:hypothetical protein
VTDRQTEETENKRENRQNPKTKEKTDKTKKERKNFFRVRSEVEKLNSSSAVSSSNPSQQLNRQPSSSLSVKNHGALQPTPRLLGLR